MSFNEPLTRGDNHFVVCGTCVANRVKKSVSSCRRHWLTPRRNCRQSFQTLSLLLLLAPLHHLRSSLSWFLALLVEISDMMLFEMW